MQLSLLKMGRLMNLMKIFKKYNILLQSDQLILTNSFVPHKFLHLSSATCMRRKIGKPRLAQLDYIAKLNESKETEPTQKLLDDSTLFLADKGMDPLDVWHSDSYDESARNFQKRQQGSYHSAPNLDHEKSGVILFPGQGTQFVGMSKHLLDFPNVREMYETASDILQYDLLELSLQGPASKLNQTKYQQPAIFVASLAAIEKLRVEQPESLENCIGTAGFSLGEITALTFAGAFTFESAIQLVKIRAEAMQIASELQPSGMMTVFYGPDSKLSLACQVAREFCQKLNLEHIDCRIASYLYPHCKVIAGNDEALKFIVENKDDFRLKKLKKIDVSGAFHTDLMKPAAYVLKEALKNINVNKPLIKVYSNVDANRYYTSEEIKQKLVKQLYMSVKWEQIMHTLYERPQSIQYPFTYECGPGNTLRSILKKVDAKAAARCWGF